MGLGALVLAMVIPSGSSGHLACLSLIFSLPLRGWEADPSECPLRPAPVRCSTKNQHIGSAFIRWLCARQCSRVGAPFAAQARILGFWRQVPLLPNFGADVRVQVSRPTSINPIERDTIGGEFQRLLHRDARQAG